MRLNAREAMHILELRSQPAGHENYRRVVQEMHRQIGNIAGHNLVSDAMSYVDHESYMFGRLGDEMKSETRRKIVES